MQFKGKVTEAGLNDDRKMKTSLRAALAAVAILFALVAPAFARNWHIANFEVTADVHQDGSALITERITAVFAGEYHGIYRTIPIEYPGPQGTNYTLFLHVIGVRDAQTGRTLKYESRRRGDYRELKIYVPGATNTDKTVEIAYEVRNGTRFFPDHDEFYWNVTGNDWPVPIDHASALLMFPQSAAGQLRAQGFTGVYGSRQQEVTAEVRDATVSFETTNPLPLRGGLTVDVFIPKGLLHEPSSITRAGWFLESNPLTLLPLISFLVMFAFWYTVGRDPDPGESVAPMYEPPKDMTPGECGTLVDDAVKSRDITCTLVDLAVKGYIKIEEVKEQHLLFSGRNYIFHLLKPRTEWTKLAAHERVMLENMFSGLDAALTRTAGANTESTSLSSLKNHFYTAIPMIKDDLIAELKEKGMYRVDPEASHGYLVAAVAIIVVVLLMLHWVTNWPLFQSGGVGIAAVIVSGIVIYLFGRKMTAKTLQGARTYVHVLGFEEFMNRVDKDRLKQMPPDTFEKYLPYAMALGVEHHWAQAFAGIIQNPPGWYVGPTPGYGFNPILFTNNMGYMTSQAHDVFVSAPRSSSTGSGWTGGGFSSGGGFSGGGFGGGGGGAF